MADEGMSEARLNDIRQGYSANSPFSDTRALLNEIDRLRAENAVLKGEVEKLQNAFESADKALEDALHREVGLQKERGDLRVVLEAVLAEVGNGMGPAAWRATRSARNLLDALRSEKAKERCEDCRLTYPHRHCPECGALDHPAALCDNMG